MYKLIFIFILTVGAVFTAETEGQCQEISLDGPWQLRLTSCFPSEKKCRQQIDPKKIYVIDTPQNLHTLLPWFFGEAEFKRTFYLPEIQKKNFNTLLIGSIGSADQVYLNNQFLSGQGYYDDNRERDQPFTVSSFNTVRAYSIPESILHNGINEILIKVKVFDIKAGLHAGPLQLGNRRSLMLSIFWYRFLREYIFLSIPLLLVAVLFVLVSTIKHWRPGEGHFFLTIAFIGYLLHSFYYIPIPWYIPYLSFLKLHWSGRIISILGTVLYFYRHFGLRNKRVEYFFIGGAMFLITSLFFQSSYANFFAASVWQQWSFLFPLWFPLIFWKDIKDRARREAYMIYLILAIPVSLTYINDALLRSYHLNTPWLYHYMSFFNIINFLYHMSYHFYLWKEQEKQLVNEKLLQQKLNLAHDLHDMVGSELSQVVVASRQLTSGAGETIATLSSDALERVRDFSHILKGQEKYETLSAKIHKTGEKLSALSRYQVFLHGTPFQNLTEKNYSKKIQSNTLIQNFIKNESRLDHYSSIQVERILSEWLANTIRHSQSDSIHLLYSHRPGRLRIGIWNNKSSFTWKGAAKRGGLYSIQRRAEFMQARVCSRSWQSGTFFYLSVPVTDNLSA